MVFGFLLRLLAFSFWLLFLEASDVADSLGHHAGLHPLAPLGFFIFFFIFFEEGDVVVHVVGSELLNVSEGGVDGPEPLEFELVVKNGVLLGEHEASGQGAKGDIFILFVVAEGNFEGFHEADVDHVLGLDLVHEVLDHATLFVICDH